MRRHRALRPLSSEHHQALLVAFKVQKSLAGHAESAGAPPDLPGLVTLVRRFEEDVLAPHARAEEELLGAYLTQGDIARLRDEHLELRRLAAASRTARGDGPRRELAAFAELLERHVRWEERELFPYAEGHMDPATLAVVGGEIEKRLVR